MTLVSIATALVLVAAPGTAFALAGVWVTDGAVGPSEVDYRVELTCPGVGLVCSLVDGYDETQTSTMTGNGTLDVDPLAGTFQIDMDSIQDFGSGPESAYLTLSGTDLTYPNIPFAGIPELVNVLVFALTNPPIGASLSVATPGDYPFSETVSYAGLAGVVGDLEFILPGIVVPPDDVVVTGVFRVLGDLDSDGGIDFELRDVTGTLAVQNPATISGELVTVDVTADMTLNLRGELGGSGGTAVPTTGVWGLGALVAMLLVGGQASCRGWRGSKESLGTRGSSRAATSG